jgi:hypothetical protein
MTILHQSSAKQKITTKNKSFFAFLLFVTTFNSYSMEPEAPTSTLVTFHDYIAYVGAVLLNEVEFNQNEFSSLKDIPEEIAGTIMGFLIINKTTTSLEASAKAINALAQVNKKLNELINAPDFCLELIKQLAKKFKCSDQAVAQALHTKAAKERLALQNEFYSYAIPAKFNKNDETANVYDYLNYEAIDALYKKGVDLSFTYTTNKGARTILRIAIVHHIFPFVADIIKYSRAYDLINQTNSQGTSLLLLCVMQVSKTKSALSLLYCKQTIKFLLKNGADPELGNKKGETPLAVAQRTGNKNVIRYIENAIIKKHQKK